jgi:hypothetical protein
MKTFTSIRVFFPFCRKFQFYLECASLAVRFLKEYSVYDFARLLR